MRHLSMVLCLVALSSVVRGQGWTAPAGVTWYNNEPEAGNSFQSPSGTYLFVNVPLPYGVLKSASLYMGKVNTPITIQIWRYVEPILKYKLVYSHTPVSASQVGVLDVTISPPVQLLSGDFLGFTCDGDYPVARTAVPNNQLGDQIYKFFINDFTGVPQKDGIYMFQQSPVDATYTYSIGVGVDPYKQPTLPPTTTVAPTDPPTTTPSVIYVNGPPGQAGPPGATGSPGFTGVQGAPGDTGVQGNPGVAGPTGSQGDQGVPGAPGAQGAPGTPGSQGVQGVKGDQGDKGDAGDQGPAGSTGEQGVMGGMGPEGPRGLQGDTGAMGVTGAQGTTGVRGEMGSTGSQGDQGAQGDTGIQGVTGPQGRIVEKNECLINNGACEDICIDNYASFECACSKGFKLESNKRSCIDINECEELNGMCGHQCSNTRGSFICTCPSGFTLDNNKLTCSDINECTESSPCQTGVCVNEPGSYKCMTAPGSSGSVSSAAQGTGVASSEFLLSRDLMIAILIWLGIVTVLVLCIIVVMCTRSGRRKRERAYLEAEEIYGTKIGLQSAPSVKSGTLVMMHGSDMGIQSAPSVKSGTLMVVPNNDVSQNSTALVPVPSRSASVWSRYQ